MSVPGLCMAGKVHLRSIVASLPDLSAALPVTKRPFPVFELTTNVCPTKGKQLLFFQKKAFNFSSGGDRRGLFEDWVEEEHGARRRGWW